MRRQGEIAMACAAIVCKLEPDAIMRLDQALAISGGEEELGQLLSRFYTLDPATRTCVLERLKPVGLRIKRG
jgi:hypothetical protein